MKTTSFVVLTAGLELTLSFRHLRHFFFRRSSILSTELSTARSITPYGTSGHFLEPVLPLVRSTLMFAIGAY